MSTLYETSDVMQTLEDAFVKEIQSVFPSTYKIYTNPMSQNIPNNSVVLILKVMNMGRGIHSDATRRRTVMFDIAVITDESSYWVENNLMDINSIKFGEITKVLTSGRFARVDGVTHLSGYFYVTEVMDV
ncbi:hypothetical protein PSYJYH_000056 [Bacillus phage PSYJ-YH]|nr:hypothetical protein PSYJYH_000056 [Bacillus phage PSYJ-YH]